MNLQFICKSYEIVENFNVNLPADKNELKDDKVSETLKDEKESEIKNSYFREKNGHLSFEGWVVNDVKSRERLLNDRYIT